MELYLLGIESESFPIRAGADTLVGRSHRPVNEKNWSHALNTDRICVFNLDCAVLG